MVDTCKSDISDSYEKTLSCYLFLEFLNSKLQLKLLTPSTEKDLKNVCKVLDALRGQVNLR